MQWGKVIPCAFTYAILFTTVHKSQRDNYMQVVDCTVLKETFLYERNFGFMISSNAKTNCNNLLFLFRAKISSPKQSIRDKSFENRVFPILNTPQSNVDYPSAIVFPCPCNRFLSFFRFSCEK